MVKLLWVQSTSPNGRHGRFQARLQACLYQISGLPYRESREDHVLCNYPVFHGEEKILGIDRQSIESESVKLLSKHNGDTFPSVARDRWLKAGEGLQKHNEVCSNYSQKRLLEAERQDSPTELVPV
jgi:hypothetical protein